MPTSPSTNLYHKKKEPRMDVVRGHHAGGDGSPPKTHCDIAAACSIELLANSFDFNAGPNV